MSASGQKRTSATVYCVCRLQIIFDPVSGEIDADLAVVDMRMLCAAFFGREDLDCLVFRTDRKKSFWAFSAGTTLSFAPSQPSQCG